MRTTVAAAALACALAPAFLLSGRRADAAEDLAAVKKAVESKQAVLVDVREVGEWNRGHLADARSLPISELQVKPELADTLPKGKTIYTHCVRGPRASKAASIMKDRGYDARALTEGYEELVKAGFRPASP